MASSVHGDPDADNHFDMMILSFVPMAEDLLSDLWGSVTGNETADKDAESTAQAAEFLPQLTEISLRISDNKTKVDTERSLQDCIRPIHKGLGSQIKSLTAWLKSRERADAFEDACLAGDSDSAILIDLRTKAVRRCCHSLAWDELFFKLHLVDSAGRMTAYIRQYAEAVAELMVLKYMLASGEVASRERQQEHLNTLMLEAAERLGLA